MTKEAVAAMIGVMVVISLLGWSVYAVFRAAIIADEDYRTCVAKAEFLCWLDPKTLYTCKNVAELTCQQKWLTDE